MITIGEINVMTTEEVATKLGVSCAIIQRYARVGRLGKRFGHRSFIFTEKEVDDFSLIERKRGNPDFRSS